VGTISDSDQPDKLRIQVSEKVPVAFRGQIPALGLCGHGGKILFSAPTRRIVGEFALEASYQACNCFCICRRTCSEFHARPNENKLSDR